MFEYGSLTTEQRNPLSLGLDRMSTVEILTLINEEDRRVPEAVAQVLPKIGQAVDLAVERLSRGGGLLYVGAGTSGRLGVLDAAECMPTFGAGPEMVSAMIAGGPEAVFHAVEESEDDGAKGYSDTFERVGESDVVIGISASGMTPFVGGALKAARDRGAATVAIVCNRIDGLDLDVDVIIPLLVGPEILTGSTRMKAGTAQKLVLNMISTTTMVKLGKVYENLMVDLQPTNRKLQARSTRIISMATGVEAGRAAELLGQSGGSIKTAVVMALTGVGRNTAEPALRETGGRVRQAIELLNGGRPR